MALANPTACCLRYLLLPLSSNWRRHHGATTYPCHASACFRSLVASPTCSWFASSPAGCLHLTLGCALLKSQSQQTLHKHAKRVKPWIRPRAHTPDVHRPPLQVLTRFPVVWFPWPGLEHPSFLVVSPQLQWGTPGGATSRARKRVQALRAGHQYLTCFSMYSPAQTLCCAACSQSLHSTSSITRCLLRCRAGQYSCTLSKHKEM